jgi:hypothetical protein
MASVKTSISFTCPNCAKVLRASARPPAGKKIKCPACGEAFVPELDAEDEEATRIQAKPGAKTKPAPSRTKDDDDDRPRSKRGRADEDDDADDDDNRPQKKSRRDEDDDDDDLPLKKKKKAKKKSGSMMLMVGGGVALGGVALLSCVLCGVGAYFWFSKSNNSEMLAFVAPDANLLIGGRPKELKTKFAPFNDMFAQIGGPAGGQNDFPEMMDLLKNSEQFLVFVNTNDFGKKTMGVIRGEAADIDRLKRSNKLEAAKTVGGHTFQRIKNQGFGGGGNDFVAFLDNRLVVIGDVSEDTMVATLNRGKKEPAKSAAIDLSHSVDKSPVWMAMTFDGAARGKLREAFNEAGKLSVGMKAAAPAVDGAKGMTLTVDVTPGNDIKLALSMMCKNGDDAAKVKKGAEEGWVLAKAGLAQAQQQVGAMMPFMNSLVKDLNSTAFSTQGDSAIATVTFSNATVQEVANAAKNNPFGAMAFGPQPMPVQQPPMPPNKDFNPPKGPRRINIFGLAAGQWREGLFDFRQGDKLEIIVTTQAGKKNQSNADFIILQGAAGENVLFTENNNWQNERTVNWIAPATGQYRLRVRNNGPNNLGNGSVVVWEK